MNFFEISQKFMQDAQKRNYNINTRMLFMGLIYIAQCKNCLEFYISLKDLKAITGLKNNNDILYHRNVLIKYNYLQYEKGCGCYYILDFNKNEKAAEIKYISEQQKASLTTIVGEFKAKEPKLDLDFNLTNNLGSNRNFCGKEKGSEIKNFNNKNLVNWGENLKEQALLKEKARKKKEIKEKNQKKTKKEIKKEKENNSRQQKKILKNFRRSKILKTNEKQEQRLEQEQRQGQGQEQGLGQGQRQGQRQGQEQEQRQGQGQEQKQEQGQEQRQGQGLGREQRLEQEQRQGQGREQGQGQGQGQRNGDVLCESITENRENFNYKISEHVGAKEKSDRLDSEHLGAKEKSDGLDGEHVRAKEKSDGLDSEHLRAKEKSDGLDSEHVRAKEESDGLDSEHLRAKESEKQQQKTFIELPLIKNQGIYLVKFAELDEYRWLYPTIDVEQELKLMRGWLLANPKRAKTKKGIKRFINNWLNRTLQQNQNYNNKTNKTNKTFEQLEYKNNSSSKAAKNAKNKAASKAEKDYWQIIKNGGKVQIGEKVIDLTNIDDIKII